MPDDAGPRNIPPGGWRYPEGGRWIAATGFPELVDAITNDRINNQQKIGDPIGDIRAYVLREFPAFAGSVSVARPPVDEDAIANNQRERITIWAANRYALRTSGNTELVSQEEADARAKVCSSCPQNQDYPKDCPSCVVNLERTLFLLRQGRETSPKVASCLIAGHDNTAAAHLPEKMLKHRNKFMGEDAKAELPDFCWMRKLA